MEKNGQGEENMQEGLQVITDEQRSDLVGFRRQLTYGPQTKVQVGDYNWTYRVDDKGCAEITTRPSPEPVGDLMIPVELEGHPVKVINEKAFVDCKGLTSVTIPDGLMMIDDEAFFGCEGLTSVTLPRSMMVIGRHAFCRCRSLKTFVVDPESPAYVFESGFLLTRDRRWLVRALDPQGEVTVPAGVEMIDVGAFSGCEGMTSVILPEGVRLLWDDAFENCSNLTTVTMPRSLRGIEYDVFYGCRRLTTIKVSAGEAKRVYELFEENTGADQRIDFDYVEI